MVIVARRRYAGCDGPDRYIVVRDGAQATRPGCLTDERSTCDRPPIPSDMGRAEIIQELRRLSDELDGQFVVRGSATLVHDFSPGTHEVTAVATDPDGGIAQDTAMAMVAPDTTPPTPDVREPLASGVAKHTNLTGGEPASCGGELWVDPSDASVLFVNGASGRYGPDSEQQLEDAVAVFEDLGYTVTSFGWDPDVDLPARVLR